VHVQCRIRPLALPAPRLDAVNLGGGASFGPCLGDKPPAASACRHATLAQTDGVTHGPRDPTSAVPHAAPASAGDAVNLGGASFGPCLGDKPRRITCTRTRMHTHTHTHTRPRTRLHVYTYMKHAMNITSVYHLGAAGA